MPNPRGINGNLDHQATTKKLLAMAKEEFAGRNVKIRENKSILSRLGLDRRPDVSVWDADTEELLKVYEAARAKRGNFAREQRKMFEYWEGGIRHWFEEVK